MGKNGFSPQQIAKILKEFENGKKIVLLCSFLCKETTFVRTGKQRIFKNDLS